ncbi:9324_t:CDS:2 [Paraglomus brasilianum]|uniref:9324_t:CDS:1 n=1 Tax=Paraglomus brasilianum TaxID=144538 RepID=A0A9N9D7R0_9GLOM|nr:9324_t:CDS:2 [Paraglomus brasilianum]
MYSSKIILIFVTLLCALSTVRAHMVMKFPTPRGPNVGTSLYQAPCASYNSPNASAITTFPLNGAAIMYFGHGEGSLVYSYAPNSNATFAKVAEPVTLLHNDTYPRNFTTNVDLKLAGAKVGDQGVLQGVYVSSNSTWYQCGDIKIADAVTTTSSATAIVSGTVLLYTTLAVVFMLNYKI